MTREELITEIRYLLFNHYIDPDFRLEVFDKLDNLDEVKLQEWLQVLRDKIVAMGSLEKFIHDVERVSSEVNDSQKSYQARLKKHPLFSLRLPKLKDRLKNKLLDYIKDGVEIKQEYELYLNSQRDFANAEDEVNFEFYEVKDVRQAFLDGMLACEQELKKKQGGITVHDLLVQYDRKFNPAGQKRAAFERNEIIEEVGLEEKQKNLARALLDAYDHIMYEDALVLNKDAREFLEEIRKNPSLDVATALQVKQKEVARKPQAVQSAKNEQKANKTEKPAKNVSTDSVQIATPEALKSESKISQTVSRLWMSDINTQAEHFKQQRIEISVLVNQLHQALLQRSTVNGLAALRVIADRGQIRALLHDRRFTQLLMAKYRQLGNKDAEVALSQDPATVIHLRNLMKHLLVERLKLNESDGAYVVSDLIGLAREKGETIEHVSYLDEADSKYHWL